MRIFTHSIISPGLSLRQCPSRCTFRAGRNLPDKEFRYLRTVIVTAAVYWGFSSALCTKCERVPLTFQHRAGVSPYTSPFGFAETYVFAKQSLGPIHCGSTLRVKHPFSRSYGVILPSSLTRVVPLTLGFSPRLPVSVCGTGTYELTRGFSWQCEIRNFAKHSLPITVSDGWTALPIQPSCCLGAHIHQCAFRILLRPPIAQTLMRWYRNIDLLSIAYAFRPRLRSRLTLRGRAFLRKP